MSWHRLSATDEGAILKTNGPPRKAGPTQNLKMTTVYWELLKQSRNFPGEAAETGQAAR
jgi:hypothetical protein